MKRCICVQVFASPTSAHRRIRVCEPQKRYLDRVPTWGCRPCAISYCLFAEERRTALVSTLRFCLLANVASLGKWSYEKCKRSVCGQ